MAAKRAWQTVNKQSGGGEKSGGRTEGFLKRKTRSTEGIGPESGGLAEKGFGQGPKIADTAQGFRFGTLRGASTCRLILNGYRAFNFRGGERHRPPPWKNS